jgi:hypothetical protein
LAFVLMLCVARVHLQDALAAELLQGHLANANAGATCRDRLPEVTAKGVL